MPTKKIRDLPPTMVCQDPDHDPPKYRLWENGVYEHTCPSCGKEQTFTINRAWVTRQFLQEFRAHTAGRH